MRTENNEQKLLEGLAVNDRIAIETIYKHHFAMIQTLVTANSGGSDDARDIFQEAMIVLYEKVRSGQFELNCQIKTYLYSVCRRLWLKRLSQMQRMTPEVNHLDETVSVEEDLESHQQKNRDFQTMERCLNNLGEPCRSLLEAYYLQKRSMMDIAESFGYTNADNAKNQKYKCLMRLKKLFHQQKK